MKKGCFSAVIAMAVTMASCSNDEVSESLNSGDDAISFRTVLDNSLARANTLTTENIRDFQVVCFDGNDKFYFGPLEVTSTDGTVWTYDGLYNWKGGSNAYHKFFAAADLGNATFAATATGAAITGFELSSGCYVDVATSTPLSDGQNDLCAAYYRGTSAHGDVSVVFQHQLAKIEVQGMNNNPNRTVEVMGVRLVNLDSKADWNYDASSFDLTATAASTDFKGVWTVTGANDGDFCIRRAGEPLVLSETYQPMLPAEEAFMVLPTTATTAWSETEQTGTYLSVICRITVNGGGGSNVVVPANGDDTKYGMAMVPVSFALEAGKKYTFKLDFSNGSGQADPTLPKGPEAPTVPGLPTDPQYPTDGSDINDISPLAPGEFYEGGPINFVVTVAEWTPADADINVDYKNEGN